MNLKKKFMVLLAAGIMVLSASPLAMAATPKPADNTVEQTQTETVNTANTAAAAQTDTTELVNKRYLTKGGAAFWFIFTILLNGALSFWIGNRFYRLARKDNHIGAEIRALRRDIEDKLVKNVGGFSEQELDIENLNESLASDDEGIKPIEKKEQPLVREVSPEEEERFRQWEAAQSKGSSQRVKSALREELNEELDDVRKIRRKTYQPKREVEETAPEEDLGETKVIKPIGEVKSKAKEILGDIFPFKED